MTVPAFSPDSRDGRLIQTNWIRTIAWTALGVPSLTALALSSGCDLVPTLRKAAL
jgi:hypothetical protein